MLLFKDSLPKLNVKLRFIHSIPGAPSVDVYANNKLIYSNLSFGNVTDYIELFPNKYNMELYISGTHDSPLVLNSVELLPNAIWTLSIASDNNKIIFLPLNDIHDNYDNSSSYVRFINLSPNSKKLSLSLPENMKLFDSVSYLQVNQYYPLSAGIYNFIVSNSADNFKKFISNVDLTQNLFITIYVIGLIDQMPELGYILLKDGK